NAAMVVFTNFTHQEREGPGGVISSDVPGYNCLKTTHRNRRYQRSYREQFTFSNFNEENIAFLLTNLSTNHLIRTRKQCRIHGDFYYWCIDWECIWDFQKSLN
ncbi:hypothetical protein HHI36_011478, partial [Cryptolaemus montrouzieri]